MRQYYWVLLLLLLFCCWLPVVAIEPKVERASYNKFTDEEGVVLGKKFAAETDRRVVLLHDRGLNDYLETLVKKLGAATQRPELTYHVSIVDSPQINAFSQPGGYVYVYRGLLNMAWNEGELAGMLAHEISHVVARHNLNRLSRHEFAMDLARRARLQGSQMELSATEVSVWEGAFSRSEETDADLLGFYTMLRAGWHPSCLITAFEGISMFTGDRQMVAQMLMTHPPTAERSRYLKEELQIADIPLSNSAGDLRRDSQAFQVMKKLLSVLPPPRGK